MKLLAATTGVPGKSVGGEVEENGTAAVILLGPAQNNALGLPPGAISVGVDFDQDKEAAGQVSPTTLLANGHIVSLAAIYSDLAHDNNYSSSVGPTSTGKKCEDEITTFRLFYSVMGQIISPRLGDVRIQAGYNYSETQSNLTNFTSDINGFSLTFAYVFNH